MFRSIFLITALLMAGSASAQVARDTVVGVDRNSLVWAGPDDIYPRVAHVMAGERVWLHGCLRQHAWCDISLASGPYRVRGWIPGNALFIPWQGQGYALSSHGIWQQMPMSDFVLSIYWGTHYSQSPWYRDRSRFDRHDWRRDQWRWERHDSRNDWRYREQQEIHRQRVIDERRQLRDQQSSGRDQNGLTPLQRQIQLQSQRARDIQKQREQQAKPPGSDQIGAPMDEANPTSTTRRPLIRESQRRTTQAQQVRQIEQEP